MRAQNNWPLDTSRDTAWKGMMVMPMPLRTIALMISTFSVSMTICGSMREVMKNGEPDKTVPATVDEAPQVP